MKKEWSRGELYTGFWWGNLREREPGVDGRIVLKWISVSRMGAWNGLIWLRIGTDGGLL
jgi:hypothetical protein